ncbi:MAG: ABC transporter permease [Bacilli bacterium]|nr:ABC transporter permease [Bacilli bacterium]
MLPKLLKQDFKESIKTWIICTAVLSVLFIAIYTAASSMSRGSILVEQFFTMFATIVPLIFVITTASKLVSAQIDDGSFFMVMVSNYKRSQIIVTKIVYYLTSILAMHLVLLLTSVIMVSAKPMDLLSAEDVLLLNLYCFLITAAVSAICFFASVFFNTKKNATLLGTGFPLVSYLLYTLAHMFTNIPNLDEQPFIQALANLKYVSIYSLFDFQLITERSSWLILIGILLVAFSAGTYAASAIVFRKKDLPL